MPELDPPPLWRGTGLLEDQTGSPWAGEFWGGMEEQQRGTSAGLSGGLINYRRKLCAGLP